LKILEVLKFHEGVDIFHEMESYLRFHEK
jgi:hypothetical protein